MEKTHKRRTGTARTLCGRRITYFGGMGGAAYIAEHDDQVTCISF